MAGPRRSAWGREIRESMTDAFGRPRPPALEDFTEVGLSEADAAAAADGLREGKYLSFEDACLSVAIFAGGPLKRQTLNESLMREKARCFAESATGQVRP